MTKEKQDVNALQGIVKNGQIVLDEPDGLPEGSRVEIHPVESPRPTLVMREENWPTTPEGIAALLARMDQVEPGGFSSEDDAAWQAALAPHLVDRRRAVLLFAPASGTVGW